MFVCDIFPTCSLPSLNWAPLLGYNLNTLTYSSSRVPVLCCCVIYRCSRCEITYVTIHLFQHTHTASTWLAVTSAMLDYYLNNLETSFINNFA